MTGVERSYRREQYCQELLEGLFVTPHQICFYRQETDYTCGPASLRTMLESLTGICEEEATLARLLQTNTQIGTDTTTFERLLPELAARYGLEGVCERSASLTRLGELLGQGYLPLVHFRFPDDGISHYGVVVGLGPHTIAIADPWAGPFRLHRLAAEPSELPHFEWDGDLGHRWLLALRRRASKRPRGESAVPK